MKPERDNCLVELLDRLLNKGVILSADLIITVAGVPLIGINLRAALASMETMLDYGLMEAWDRDVRNWYSTQSCDALMDEGEKLLFKSFGYIWQDHELSKAWVPGVWHISNKRLFLWRRDSGKIIFELKVDDVWALTLEEEAHFSTEGKRIRLMHSLGEALVYIAQHREFCTALEAAALRNLSDSIFLKMKPSEG